MSVTHDGPLPWVNDKTIGDVLKATVTAQRNRDALEEQLVLARCFVHLRCVDFFRRIDLAIHELLDAIHQFALARRIIEIHVSLRQSARSAIASRAT